MCVQHPSATNVYQPVLQDEPLVCDDDIPHSPSCSDPTQLASLTWIYVLCIANFGISSAWALEFAITTPYFEKGLNAGPVISHLVWIVGPLSGLIVAPIVGTLSDTCTHRLGRRRPFIIGGVVATVIGMLMFSNASQLASTIFAKDTEPHRISAIVIGIIAFCILDLAINTTMWPVRALQGDLVPASQQHVVQSASMVMGSLGDLAVNALVNSFETPVAHIRISYYVAAAVFSSTILTLIYVGQENAVDPEHPSIQDQGPQSLNIFEYLRGLPTWMWRIGGTYALGFFALFCCMPNASNWIGSSVLGGDPSKPDTSKEALEYERGVKIYGQAGLYRALLQIGYSMAYPWLLRTLFTEGQLLGLCFGVFGVLVAVFSDTTSIPVARLIVVSMALPMASEFTVPVGMTIQSSDETNRGRYLGALNCFAVLPQLVDTTYTGFVSRRFGEAAVMKIGAAWAILTAISAFLWMPVLHNRGHH